MPAGLFEVKVLVGCFDQVGSIKFIRACSGVKLLVVWLVYQVVRDEWCALLGCVVFVPSFH